MDASMSKPEQGKPKKKKKNKNKNKKKKQAALERTQAGTN